MRNSHLARECKKITQIPTPCEAMGICDLHAAAMRRLGTGSLDGGGCQVDRADQRSGLGGHLIVNDSGVGKSRSRHNSSTATWSIDGVGREHREFYTKRLGLGEEYSLAISSQRLLSLIVRRKAWRQRIRPGDTNHTRASSELPQLDRADTVRADAVEDEARLFSGGGSRHHEKPFGLQTLSERTSHSGIRIGDVGSRLLT